MHHPAAKFICTYRCIRTRSERPRKQTNPNNTSAWEARRLWRQALPAPLASQILIRRPMLPSACDQQPRSSDLPSKACVSSSGPPTAPLVASLATGCTGSHPTVPNYSLERSTAHVRFPAAHVRVRISMPQRLGQPYVSIFGMNTLQRCRISYV